LAKQHINQSHSNGQHQQQQRDAMQAAGASGAAHITRSVPPALLNMEHSKHASSGHQHAAGHGCCELLQRCVQCMLLILQQWHNQPSLSAQGGAAAAGGSR